MRRREALARWGVVWSPLVVLAITRLLVEDFTGAVVLAGSAACGLLAAASALYVRRATVLILRLALVSLLLAATLEATLAPLGWHTGDKGILRFIPPQTSAVDVRGIATRRWHVPDAAERVVLSAEAVSLRGDLAWSWFRSDARIAVAPDPLSGKDAAVVRFPTQRDPYLQRTYDLGFPAGNVRLRASLELLTAALPGACHGLRLQIRGDDGGRRCSPDRLDGGWTRQQVVWTVPPGVQDTVVRVVVNDLNGQTVTLRNARLEKWDGDAWLDLSPLFPTVPFVGFGWDGPPRMDHGIPLSLESPLSGIQMETPMPEATPDTVTVGVAAFLNSGGILTLRGVDLQAIVAGTPVPMDVAPMPPSRLSYGFFHPNLAAHVALALGGAAVATGGKLVRIAAPIVSLVLIVASGSRSGLLGWFILLGALIVWRWFAVRNRIRIRIDAPPPRLNVLVLCAILILVSSTFVLLMLVRGGLVDNPTDRWEIWQVSLQALKTHPWLGIDGSTEDFRSFWQHAYSGNSREPVSHAHNIFLHFGASFGFPGFAALALVVGLWWRLLDLNANPAGAATLLAVLAANMGDVTLLHSWVLAGTVAASALSVTGGNSSDSGRTRPSEGAASYRRNDLASIVVRNWLGPRLRLMFCVFHRFFIGGPVVRQRALAFALPRHCGARRRSAAKHPPSRASKWVPVELRANEHCAACLHYLRKDTASSEFPNLCRRLTGSSLCWRLAIRWSLRAWIGRPMASRYRTAVTCSSLSCFWSHCCWSHGRLLRRMHRSHLGPRFLMGDNRSVGYPRRISMVWL